MIITNNNESIDAIIAILKDIGSLYKADGSKMSIDDFQGYVVSGLKEDDFNPLVSASTLFSETSEKSSKKEDDGVIFSSESGAKVSRWSKPKLYKPLILPALKSDEDTAVISKEAIASIISTIPKGKVATIGRVKSILFGIYACSTANTNIDVSSNWDEYKEATGMWIYAINSHRVVSDNGEINGNGMSAKKEKVALRRKDMKKLNEEGIQTIEKNSKCLVENLSDVEYDFSDLIVAIEND